MSTKNDASSSSNKRINFRRRTDLDIGMPSARVVANDEVVRAAVEDQFGLHAELWNMPIKAQIKGTVATIAGTSLGIVGAVAATLYLGGKNHQSEWLTGILALAEIVAIAGVAIWMIWLRAK